MQNAAVRMVKGGYMRLVVDKPGAQSMPWLTCAVEVATFCCTVEGPQSQETSGNQPLSVTQLDTRPFQEDCFGRCQLSETHGKACLKRFP